MADTAGQSAADSEAADRREAHLKAAADSLAAQRARDDEEIAQQRLPAAARAAAYSEAADGREPPPKAAADSLAAQRARDDEEIAQQRLAEDEALADARTEQDRVLASSRARLSVAASAVQSATTAVWGDADPGDPHTADLRTAVAELQAALADHLDLVPDQATEGTVAP